MDENTESASDHVQISGSTPPHRSTVVLWNLLFYTLRRIKRKNVTKKIEKYAAIIVFLISNSLQLKMILENIPRIIFDLEESVRKFPLPVR